MAERVELLSSACRRCIAWSRGRIIRNNWHDATGMELTRALEEAVRCEFTAADSNGTGSIDFRQAVVSLERLLGHELSASRRRLALANAELHADSQGRLQLEVFENILMETLAETTQWGKLHLETNGYVGIDTLQEQIRKKVIKRGFEFNIIVVGRSGLGKSTLVNTLFKANVSRRTCTNNDPVTSVIPPTTEVKSVSHVIEEKGMRVRLTVTDTPGFGDHINNDNCWLPIQEYINDQYEKFLSEEQNVNRKRHIPDTRVHCCLYFIAPTGHSLKSLDIEFMRRLDKCVNIVPIIAKADTLTLEERLQFKARIKEDLVKNGISIYPRKDLDDDEDPDDIALNNKIRDMIPFAIVGSNQQYPINGRNLLGRRTQWGVVEVENRAHCEFADLRDMLIRTHMQDLVEVTTTVNYENFRQERLQASQLNGKVLDLQNMNESCL